MKLKEIGEFGFINRFANTFDGLIKGDELGIGDDCAVLTLNETESYVASTDLLVEDIHFVKGKISARELGAKSLAVNLSDVAAMGGDARFSFLSLGIPPNTDVEFLDEFMAGYSEMSEKYGVPLMGGDTTKSPDKLLINVVAIGQCKKEDIRLRSMAKPGDVICVTGMLGDSAGGLKAILGNIELSDDVNYLINKHHQPVPRLEEGQWLARQAGVHAMMDISDGISSDLMHILKASGVASSLNLSSIPSSDILKQLADENDWNYSDLALSGGEDYELLITVKADDLECIQAEFQREFSKPLYAIGEVLEGAPSVSVQDGEQMSVLHNEGFNHFM